MKSLANDGKSRQNGNTGFSCIEEFCWTEEGWNQKGYKENTTQTVNMTNL